MAQNAFDQLSKQYLEEFLAPIGTVQRQYEIPGEAKFVDVWFVPDPNRVQPDLGLLGQMVQSSCLLEPYRNAPTRTEVRVSVMKLIWIQEDERRKAQNPLPESDLPTLWILAATSFRPLLEEAGCFLKPDWIPGIYFMADLLKTAIVVIDQLPETEETLWLRVLGRDATQERAIREVLALPLDHPWRDRILRLLASWKVRIDLNEIENFSGQEALMALSEAFLQWEQQHEEQVRREERQEIARNLLRTNMPLETIAEVTGLKIAQLQQLQAQQDS